MGLCLARNLGQVSHLEAGEYTVETVSGEPAISCPSCSGISDLDMSTHRVLRGGMVSPIWSCPSEGCALQDFLTLEAWP